MLFSKDKEDDDDFYPSPNFQSNLSSLFGNSGNEGNPNLTYTAPKQPKRQGKAVSNVTPPSSSTPTTSVILVKVVHTFKMVDQKYQSQGKMGAALLSGKTSEEGPYQLLLYREKRQHVCICTVTRDFQFLVQPKNYCTFFDSQGGIWSILFERASDLTEFTFQVALAKWKAEDSGSPILIQDLWCPVSNDPSCCTAEVGDSVDLAYTLFALADSSQGQETEEIQNVSVVVEGSGWKQGLIGVQPSSKRAIILQPYMLGDLNPTEIPYKSPVVVKFTVVQICKAASTEKLPTLELNKITEELQRSHSQPVCVERSVNNISPRSSPKSTKADLISRMAKMGQALPFKGVAPTPSDSDDTEEDQAGRLSKIERAVPKPRTRVQNCKVPTERIAPVSLPVSVVQHSVPLSQHAVSGAEHSVPFQWASTSYMGGSMISVPQLQSPVDSSAQFNMFLSEVRITNSEVRMGVTRLNDKIEALHSKIEDSDKTSKGEVSSVLERLLENQEQMKEELHFVKNALTNCQQPSSQGRPSGDRASAVSGAEPCALCAEKDKANSAMTEKLKKTEEENEYLQTSISAQKDALQNVRLADQDQMAQIDTLQKQLQEKQVNILELNQKLQDLQRERENATGELQKTNRLVVELQNTIQERQTNIDKLEQALKDSEATNLEEVKRNLQEVLDPKPLIGEHVKKILNAVYRLVKVQFEPENKYEAPFIQSVIAETIKAVTLEYLENGDLLLAEMQQKTMSTIKVNQTQSSPVFSAEHGKIEDNSRQYLKKEPRTAPTTEPDLLASVSGEELPISAPKASQNTSTDSLYSKSDFSPKNTEHPARTNQNIDIVTKNSVPVNEDISAVDSVSSSSEDVWRPQPPPIPLFGEDENDDDWVNS